MVDIKKQLGGMPTAGMVPETEAIKNPAMGTPTGAGAPLGAAPEMSEEAMRADLEGKRADLQSQRGAVNASFYVSKNKIESAKTELIKAVFAILKEVGVDPTDLESIQGFIQQLEQEDPDLLKLFNVAFDSLSGAPEIANEVADSMDAGAPPMNAGDGTPPIGVDGLGPNIPMPPNPMGDQPPVAQPSIGAPGGQFGNVSEMMPPV